MDHAEIHTIRRQYEDNQWPQFLKSLRIGGLRGWSGQSVEFRFPVVAVVGMNGSGKSTLLKAAACPYDTRGPGTRFYPSSLFLDTRWDVIEGVTMEYEVKLGDSTRNLRITKPTKRWRTSKNLPIRSVFLLDISRTLPLDASVGYAKIARQAAAEVESTDISADFCRKLSHVLSCEYAGARFATSNVDEKRQVGLLTREWGELSQFHQGAGEDATLDLFRTIEGIPRHSLLLIDEVEASLHPSAQRRLVRFLLHVSRQRRIQIILTTHSPYVVRELPPEAIVMLRHTPAAFNVLYGVSTEFAMDLLDDDKHPEVYIFVEDDEAGQLLREIIVSDSSSSDLLQRIDIRSVGPSNVVITLGQLGKRRKLPYKSLAVLDGDASDSNCLSLPGEGPPERLVYTDLQQLRWSTLHERFGLQQDYLQLIMDDAMREPDHHKWNALIGSKIFKGPDYVWGVLASEWCRLCLHDVDRVKLVDAIQAACA